MAGPPTRERRMFSAIGFVHPDLTSVKRVLEALNEDLGRPTSLRRIGADWDTARVEYLNPRNLYPDHVVDPDDIDRGGMFAHDVYVVVKDLGPGIGSVAFIASPYVRLFDRINRRLRAKLSTPAVRYLRVDMQKVYDLLRSDNSPVSVARVTLRILKDENVQLVTLTGKMPLHSDLHESLQGITEPYGAGALVEMDGHGRRVTVNRLGRVNWYQSDEATLDYPLSFLTLLSADDAFFVDRRYPMGKATKQLVGADPEAEDS